MARPTITNTPTTRSPAGWAPTGPPRWRSIRTARPDVLCPTFLDVPGQHGHHRAITRATIAAFDLAADPNEKKDLGQDPAFAAVRSECEAALRKVVDPEKADREAKADQAAKIASIGGKEAILKRGTFRYSPPPGVKPTTMRTGFDG